MCFLRGCDITPRFGHPPREQARPLKAKASMRRDQAKSNENI